MSEMAFSIVIPVYEKVNQLDVAAPLEMFGWRASYDHAKDIQISLAAEVRGVVNTYSPSAANGAGSLSVNHPSRLRLVQMLRA